MSSIIPGYEYDMFISYRQKDNKGDRWVSRFVEYLKTELESTFKEEISVYFDVNPHDGLLETHDVDASLKDKLKCLVFIPILSRTYCDPKSFAWEHEFKAFVEQSLNDQFGIKVKLPNGNVASRVLPVRIHELDKEDINLCESVLGGYLRGVEFVYREPGVNRPLLPGDKEKKNLNKTNYRNQVNKAANAIKEIITGMKSGEVPAGKKKVSDHLPWEEKQKVDKPGTVKSKTRSHKARLISGIIAAVMIISLLVLYFYPKFGKRINPNDLITADGRISIAVMPFQNHTNDTSWNFWEEGIQADLIYSLSNTEELKVTQIESIKSLIDGNDLKNNASLTPSVASFISKKLDANVCINGSLNKAGSKIRLNTQLINTQTKEIFKSFQIDFPAREDWIMNVDDSLSKLVRNYLVLTKIGKEVNPDLKPYHTNSPEAFKYFIIAGNAWSRGDLNTSLQYYKKAADIDTSFTAAIVFASMRYADLGNYNDAKEWCIKAYNKREHLPEREKLLAEWYHAELFEGPEEEIKYLEQYVEYDDQVPVVYWHLGRLYNELFEYNLAIPEFEKALEIYSKWGIRPMAPFNYINLGYAYHKTGQYIKERSLYKKAEKDFPDNSDVSFMQAVLAFSEGDSISANKYIERYIFLEKQAGNDADTSIFLAGLYNEVGSLNKAEKNYRKALSLYPENPFWINAFAYFLIEKNRNINEGISLADKALKLSPDNWAYLDTKGYGLYKQGKYNEALELLEKSWKLKPIYNRDIYLHLQEVRKAIAY